MKMRTNINIMKNLVTVFFGLFCLFALSSCSSLFGIAGDVAGGLAGEATKEIVSGFAGDFVGELAGDFVGDVTDDMVSNSENVIKAAEELSPETEYYIGRVAAANVLRDNKLYKNKALNDYVNKICSTLTLNSEKPFLYKGYFVAVIDSDDINAISTPGGHIFISKGLIDCATSEDALAGVIAHEISHIQLGHSSSAIRGDRGLDAIKQNFINSLDKNIKIIPSETIQSLNNLGDGFVTKLMKSGFSQGQEFDADGNALKLMKDAGYNPYALVSMLEEIDKKTDSGSGWFKTHPKPRDRIRKVQSQLKRGHYEEIDMEPREARFQKIKNSL